MCFLMVIDSCFQLCWHYCCLIIYIYRQTILWTGWDWCKQLLGYWATVRMLGSWSAHTRHFGLALLLGMDTTRIMLKTCLFTLWIWVLSSVSYLSTPVFENFICLSYIACFKVTLPYLTLFLGWAAKLPGTEAVSSAYMIFIC